MNPEEFPELPQINIENSITIEQNTLKKYDKKNYICSKYRRK